MTHLRHGRLRLALHQLSEGDGVPLLLLHALYTSSRCWADLPEHWRGPVFALDFSGHGDSERIRGGAYTPEMLLGDADVALAEIGSAALAGEGIGAYVALLLAGARPEQVPAALLFPGSGFAGGGDQPDYSRPFAIPVAAARAENHEGHDPFLRMLEFDVRPADYATRFAAAATKLLMPDLGSDAPSWWSSARKVGRVETVEPNQISALQRLAALVVA